MSSPLVSVVVATYNYGHYLPQALESILAQTFTDWEAIVVDDGSTDDTPRVMEPYLVDGRIRYLRTENQGQPAAENTGIRSTNAHLIAFLDADDVWLPKKLEKQLRLFARDPDVGVVYSRNIPITPVGVPIQIQRPPRVLFRGRVLDKMFLDNFVCFSSSMVRRRVFDEVGLFNESCRHASDYEFWLRVAQRYTFDYVDEPLVKYRTGHANLTSSGDTQLRTALKIMSTFCEEHRGLLSRPLVRRAFAETYCSLGFAQRNRCRRAALISYLKALRIAPLRYGSWRGLAALALPESARHLFRRVLGRPQDWRDVHELTNKLPDDG